MPTLVLRVESLSSTAFLNCVAVQLPGWVGRARAAAVVGPGYAFEYQAVSIVGFGMSFWVEL